MTLYVVLREGEADPVYCSFDRWRADNFVDDNIDRTRDDADEQRSHFRIDEYEGSPT